MPNSTSHQDLLNRIARGETQQIIEDLLGTKDLPEDRRRELITISARHKRLQSGRRMGLLSFQDDHISESQIVASLVDLIELPSSVPFPEEKSINHKVPLRTVWWKYVVAAGVIIGILAGLTTLFVNLGRILGPEEYSSNSLTVLVHGEKGKDQLILPSRGIVTLVYGNATATKEINNRGEAVFLEISDKFFEHGAKVEIIFQDPKGEPYRAIHHDSLYQLQKGQHIAIAVKLYNLDKIKGIVRDFETSDPIDSVRVSVNGVATYTNAFGEYQMQIPDSLQRQFQTIRAMKAGYEFYELQDVPVQTGANVVVVMRRRK